MSQIRHFKLWGVYVLDVYMSGGGVCVLGGICPGGKCPWPRGYMSGGKCPGGTCLGGGGCPVTI